MERVTLSKHKNNIAQTFSSDCSFSCHKVFVGEEVKFKGDNKFQIDKQCTVNGTGLMDATIGSLANLEFAASRSSNAQDASKGRVGFPGEPDPAISRSRQELNTTIGQTAVDMCNTETTDQISKVEFLTGRQTFDGPVALVQDRTTKPACVLSEALTSSALATITADNSATSGKDKKGNTNTTLWIAVAAIVSGSVLSGIGISDYLKKKKKSS